MRHIFYIDDLEKLNLKKDTTLFFALTLQNQGVECFVLFEKNLGWGNQTCTLSVQKFEGFLDGFYLSEFKLGTTELIAPRKGDTIHMRLDPPFDSRYLRYLWILDQWERRGVRVINRPRGIMQFNEKLLAYEQTGSVPSWVGQDLDGFREFHQFLKAQKVKDIICGQDLRKDRARFCVSYSGGADSGALLYIFMKLYEEGLILKPEVVYFNHNLRGKESADEEKFVSKICEYFKFRKRKNRR
jgi:hypothetical protein